MKQRPHYTTKQYYRCFLCPEFRTECGGRPTRDLDIKGWCEYISDTIDFFHLSPAVVAKEADSSLKTLERIRSGSIDQDILRGTARRYELAVFGAAARHICDMDFDATAAEKISALEKKLADMKEDRDLLAQIIKQFINKDK